MPSFESFDSAFQKSDSVYISCILEKWITHTSSLTGQWKDMPSSAKLAECAWDIADLLEDAELIAVGLLMGPTSLKEVKN